MEENARKRNQQELGTPVAKRARKEVSTPKNRKGLYSGDRSSVRRSGRLSAQKKTHQSPAGPTSSPVFQAGYQTPIRKKKKPCRGSKGPRRKTTLHNVAEYKNRYMYSVEWNDYTFRVGDHAYVILDEEKLEMIDEDDEPCAKCMRSSPDLGDMIECDKCLAGYHFNCLTPPIVSVPECEWYCPVCEIGGTHPPRDPATYRELFLQTDEVLTICDIKEIWREDNGDIVFSGPRYIRPEATYCGRQPFHGAREIFRLDFSDEYEIERLIRPVKIHSRANFAVLEKFADDDVFLAESEYSFTTKKFCKLKESNLQDEGSTSQEDSEYTPAQDSASQFGSMHKKSSIRGLLERQGGGESKVYEKIRPLDLNSLSKTLDEGGKYPEIDSDAYGRAKLALTLTALPKCLPCRDAEKMEIESFVNRFSNSGKGSSTTNCLYICGVPGTGKTATVLETVRNCGAGKSGQKSPHFQFVELNCFQLPSPQHLYSHLLRALTDVWQSPATALQQLSSLFTSPKHTATAKRKSILVLVDEVDALITQNQKVLYNLSEWCSTRGSKLGIIGIANTLDLPERLHPRIKSRMGHHRMCFKPYSREQMVQIIKGRLEGIPAVFNELSIKLAAAKVSGINGDVRRALELLRLALDVYRDDQDKSKTSQVMMHHVQAAFTRMFQTPVKQLIGNTSPLEKVILAACVLDAQRTGRTEAYSGEIVDRVHTLLQNAMMPGVKTGAVLAKIVGMGQRRLLICGSTDARLWQKIALNCGHDDVIAVVHLEESLGWLHRVLCFNPSGS